MSPPLALLSSPKTVTRGKATVIGWKSLVLILLVAAIALPPAHAAVQRDPSVVRFPFPQDDGRLTPYTFELGYSLVTLIYDTLTWRDANGVARPWLAREIDRSRDGRVVTIRLDERARWHDGRDVTAQDVAFTFDFVQSHYHPRFTPQLANLGRAVARDRSTVVLRLRRPSPGLLDQPLADIPILPRHLWADLPGEELAPPGLPVGSGPYRLVDYRPGQGYTLRANQAYFRGRPSPTTLQIPFITDFEEMVRTFERRRIDAIPVNLPEEASDRLQRFAVGIARGSSYLGTILLFNVRRPPFDRAPVRRAVAQALDLTRLARSVGQAVPADRGYLHPASLWSSPRRLHRFDASAARAALARLDLPALRILAPSNDPVRREAGRQVVLALNRVGVQAQLQEVPPEELSRAVGEDGAEPAFAAAIWSSPALASYDPDFLRAIFGSDPSRAPLNYSGFQSRAFDELAERVATIRDDEARRRAVSQELQLLARDAPVVPLFFPQGAFAYRPSIYDGWVFVKGTGIIDKLSFLSRGSNQASGERSPSPRAPPEARAGSEETEPTGGGTFGLLSLALLAAAAIVVAAAFLRRRRR